MGFRIEHPQATINELQYRQWASQTLDSRARRGYGKVPVADYKLTAQVRSAEVYIFTAIVVVLILCMNDLLIDDIFVIFCTYLFHRCMNKVDVTEALSTRRHGVGGDRIASVTPTIASASDTAGSSTTSNDGSSSSASRRDVYSFCMCPGGQIVPTSMDDQHV